MANDYKPTSRRPIADMFRKTAGIAVRICVAAHIHPDAVSYSSIVISAFAGACFWQASRWPWLLLIGPLFCYVRLWLNMLDGMVALASGKASLRGEILNDLPDRISDVLIFAGVAHSGLAAPWAGYWAAIFALLTAYVGMMGQAVGVQREFSGIMSKPWRMVTLHIGAWISFFQIRSGHGVHGLFTVGLHWSEPGRSLFTVGNVGASLSVLDWTCLIVVVGCIQTIAIRLKKIMAALEAKQEKIAR